MTAVMDGIGCVVVKTIVLLQKHSHFSIERDVFGLRLTGRPQLVGKWSMDVELYPPDALARCSF